MRGSRNKWGYLVICLERMRRSRIMGYAIEISSLRTSFSLSSRCIKLGDFGEGKFLTDIDETEEFIDLEEIK